MAAERKPKAARKKKPRRAQREEFVDYVVEIEGWDWGYSLSLNIERQPIDPYHEFRHLQINGKLLHPAGLKTDRAEVLLLPTFRMGEEQRKDFEPLALGRLEADQEKIIASVGIPLDVLPPMLQMLIAGQFRFVLMRGAKFRYGSAKLHSLRLEMKLSEDDMPTADEAIQA